MRLVIAALVLCGMAVQSQARTHRIPEKRPLAVDLPEKRSEAIGKETGVPPAADHEPDAEHETVSNEAGEKGAPEEEQPGIPPLPERAPIPSLRNPRIASEPYGPPPPPETWSAAEIADAKAQCDRLLKDDMFDYKALPPIKEGVCGAPAPIQLEYINETPRVEMRPAPTMRCELAAALERWLEEVVQPLAKELLQANVIRLVNLGSYQCRTRYGNPHERISYHASAEAIDIAEFVTAKGEHIKVEDFWSSPDERGAFLKQAHDGACKIFGTVLGPEANAAHKNHFHVDMAQRRYSAFCE